jgi:hypothetical protein
MSLPTGHRGQWLALGITVVGCALLWIGIVAPLLQVYGDRDDALHRQQAILRRMAALADTLPALREQISAAATIRGEADALLPGSSDALAAAGLQQKLDAAAKISGLRIGSEEIIPAQASGSFRKIAVRVTINAPWQDLVNLLRAVAEADSPMVVDDLMLRGPVSNEHDLALPVDASFTVSSLRAAEATSGQAPSDNATDVRSRSNAAQP